MHQPDLTVDDIAERLRVIRDALRDRPDLTEREVGQLEGARDICTITLRLLARAGAQTPDDEPDEGGLAEVIPLPPQNHL